ncbi:NAD(P)/FAD-dependent oxidoreductase [Wenzhouxiangella marina]|uniref:Hydroxylase n=1 Tax=Wenzhouxiangella marina TaxID=1579979 RepID=A0A0K0Y087_9GAMM|nr:NAD(P)/FAD-dependent oxidoreductase [Wenzhouxiangella marina]AKS43358.1 hydroxylase [Wenzhouxiangella marina]MBB6088527.1 flavin-dependent dehydrogenase [Wenzhouxiangella marina]
MNAKSLQELPERVDVAVIGGGPAGSTLAALVAREGHSVLVLEKDEHPRFHIGESLLPHNLQIFRRLGLLDAVREIGVDKLGVDFTSHEPDAQAQEIRFAEALDLVPGCEQAFQVRRSDFDRLLFEHAGKSGAELATGVRVGSVDLEGDPVLDLVQDGERRRIEARFVVDASGRDALLARQLKLQERNREHGTAALYGHFKGVPRREGDSAGNISIYWFDEGWIWMIPLPDGVMSVGAVCNPDYLRSRRGAVQEFFDATLQRNPQAWARMREAECISPITATGNYSYRSRQLSGPNWLMVGDAGVFVDPVFSSGVYFGMHSAECGAEVVLAELAGDRTAARQARRRHRQRLSRGVRELSWFIYRFPAPGLKRLFLNPRNVFGLKQAIVAVLAGDVFDNPRIFRRLRLFRLIYLISSLADGRAAWRARQQRRYNARVEFDGVA